MASGWIKLHRKILDSEHYGDSQYVHVWIHLLLNATHAEIERTFKGRRIVLKPGQLITGRKAISRHTGVHESKVRRILERLKQCGQIEQQAASKNSLITVLNWALYQEKEPQLANSRTPSDPLADTYKKEEERMIKENTQHPKSDDPFHPPTLEEVLDHAAIIGMPEEMAEDFFFHYESQGWMRANKLPVKKWKPLAQAWMTNPKPLIQPRKKPPAPLEADYENPNDPLTGTKSPF